jgi:hypothetical protein
MNLLEITGCPHRLLLHILEKGAWASQAMAKQQAIGFMFEPSAKKSGAEAGGLRANS